MKIGLKCYDFDLALANSFAHLFDFVEVLITPDFNLNELKDYSFKMNIHTAHENYGFAPAKNDIVSKELYEKAIEASDIVGAEYLVAHPGQNFNDDSLEEMINFFKTYNDKRMVLENIISPYFDGTNYLCCFKEEMNYALKKINCNFLFDVGHAIVSANRTNLDPKKQINNFLELSPKVYHVYGVDINATKSEQHLHFHNVNTDYSYFKNFNKNAIYTLETAYLSKSKLEDYVKNINFLKENILTNCLA
jgi:sugar phosphate isomerase/epimerase